MEIQRCYQMARIKGKSKGTTFTTEDRMSAGNPCGCGRSPTGQCCGWHSLNEEAYQAKRDAWDLAQYQKQAQGLWFDGGSCTGGKPE